MRFMSTGRHPFLQKDVQVQFPAGYASLASRFVAADPPCCTFSKRTGERSKGRLRLSAVGICIPSCNTDYRGWSAAAGYWVGSGKITFRPVSWIPSRGIEEERYMLAGPKCCWFPCPSRSMLPPYAMACSATVPRAPPLPQRPRCRCLPPSLFRDTLSSKIYK